MNVFDIEMIRAFYAAFPEKVQAARQTLGKPLTLSEKILYAHLWQANATEVFTRGQ